MKCVMSVGALGTYLKPRSIIRSFFTVNVGEEKQAQKIGYLVGVPGFFLRIRAQNAKEILHYQLG